VEARGYELQNGIEEKEANNYAKALLRKGRHVS
jgi:hypothetical protein